MKNKSPQDRVREAMENHHAKLANKKQRLTKNKKPEKEVERYCMAWMSDQGWDVQVLEAKATYNPRAGRYLRNQSVAVGTVDCVGTLTNGIFVAIEFKSPGRLSTFAHDRNFAQRDYLLNKIHSGAFACVTDSVARLEKVFAAYQEALLVSPDKAKNILLSYLPKRDVG